MTKKMLLIGLLITLIITLNGCYSDDPKPNEKAAEVPNSSFSESVETTAEPEPTKETEPEQTEVNAQEETEYSKVIAETDTTTVSATKETPKSNDTEKENKPETTEKTIESTKPEEDTPSQSEPKVEKESEPETKPDPPKETVTQEPETPAEEFNIDYWIAYAKNYATSIGLELDVTAVDCWDNPIAANPKCTTMESSVKNHTKTPSFFAKSTGKAQTVELEWDGSQYTATLTDTNKVLGNYKFSSNHSDMKFTVNGNKLVITTTTAPSSTVTITAEKQNSQRKGVIVWDDGTYAPGVGNQNLVTYAQSVNDPVKGFLKVKVSYGSCEIVKSSEDIDTGVIPKFALCSDGANWFKNRGQWADNSHEPVAGTIIFFDWEQDGETDHVGIVQKCENGIVYTVEGNSGDTCRTKTYSVGSASIYGYGIPAY